MNKNMQSTQWKFMSFYFLSYVSFGAVMSNFTPFLSQLGYDPMQRGILLSSYAITTILFQLCFGVFVDRFQTIKKIVILTLSLFAGASIIFYSQTGINFSLHLLIVALSGGLLNTLCGLYDTWILGCEKEISNKLSFIKAFGSIGWAIGSVCASYIIMMLTYRGISITIACILLLLFLNLRVLKDIEKIPHAPKVSGKDIIMLLKDKQYMLLISILFLLYSMVVANNCTVIDKMIMLGANQTQISLKWSMQSLLEIPTYMLGSIILRKFNHYTLLKFSACMLSLQFILFALSNSVSSIIMLSIFQLFSTPLLLITSKTLIYKLSKPELRGSSQLIALSIFTGLSSLMIPTIAGSLSVGIGINATLYVITMLGICAYFLLYILKSKYVKNDFC